jgi:hypothetical protein
LLTSAPGALFKHFFFFFLKRQNIINRQARARRTNKLGWEKNTKKGKSVALQTPARTKTPLKTTQKQKDNTPRIYMGE